MFHIPINPTGILGRSAAFVGKHSPLILICAAACGAVSSCIQACKATIKAEQVLERRRNEIAYETDSDPEEIELTPREKFQACWKLYLVPAIGMALAIGCMFLSLRISTGRNIALAGLYSSSQEALRRYEDKVIETVGEKTNDTIKNKVIDQKLADHPAPGNMIPGKDEYLCYDDFTDRYWMGNLNVIQDAAHDINEMLDHCMYIPLNDFYEKIGLGITGVGRETGWTVDEKLDLDWTTKRASNGYPCLVIFYSLAEHYNKGFVFE